MSVKTSTSRVIRKAPPGITGGGTLVATSLAAANGVTGMVLLVIVVVGLMTTAVAILPRLVHELFPQESGDRLVLWTRWTGRHTDD
jgi:hypothetical protein